MTDHHKIAFGDAVKKKGPAGISGAFPVFMPG